MTATSAADYPSLGFDPTPGDTTEVNRLARDLSNVSWVLDEIRNVLVGAADGDWEGKAARAFRDLMDDELTPKIVDAYDSFSGAQTQISTWSGDLWDFQSRARSLEAEAVEAQQRADAAQSTLTGLPGEPAPGTPPPEDPADKKKAEDDAADRTAATSKLNSANDDLADIRRRANDLKDEWEARGKEIADKLKESTGIAPEEPGFFGKIGDFLDDINDAINDFMAEIGDHIMEALQEWAPLLAFIGDLASVFSTVLGLLAFIPGLQFLALPALILGGIALGMHYLSAVGTTGSFLEALKDPTVIMDAISVVLGVGAFKLAGNLTTVAKAAGNTRSVPQLLGDNIDVPLSLFAMAGGGRSMGNPEMMARLYSLKGNQASGLYDGIGSFNTITDWVTNGTGPMTNKPRVVKP